MKRAAWVFVLIALFLASDGYSLGSEQKQSEINGESHGRSFTLRDLYRLGLKNSERIEISEENLFISRETREKAFAVLVPRFTGFGEYMRYRESKSIADILLQPEWTAAAGIKMTQSVTINGKELIAFRMAEDDIERNRWALYGVKESYLFEIAKSYYNVLKGQRGVEISEAAVKRLKKHLESVSIRLKIGEVSKTALFRAEAELSQAQADLIGAKNNLIVLRSVLADQAGLPGNFEVRPPTPHETTKFPGLEELKRKALLNRAEIREYSLKKKIAGDMVRIAKSEYWPVLSAEGGALYQDQQGAPDGVDKDLYYVGLTLSIDLFDGGLRKADIRENLARKRQADLALKQLKKEISLAVKKVYFEMITYKSQMKSFEDQLEFARENFIAVSRQFEHGLANSVDVMDANTLLVTSQKQLSESRYDFLLSMLKLDRTTGEFLKKAVPDQTH